MRPMLERINKEDIVLKSKEYITNLTKSSCSDKLQDFTINDIQDNAKLDLQKIQDKGLILKEKLYVKMTTITNGIYKCVQTDSTSALCDEKNSHISSDVDQISDEENKTSKPNHSYISLIANAILSSKEKRLVLSDIYNHVLENFMYFRNKGPGWRNSIRHNLSLNECFIKAGRSPNGKGHYWAINPANYEDFSKGDFRRRRAQRRARRALTYYKVHAHSPSLYSNYTAQPAILAGFSPRPHSTPLLPSLSTSLMFSNKSSETSKRRYSEPQELVNPAPKKQKRGFDVESLLKDDKELEIKGPKIAPHYTNELFEKKQFYYHPYEKNIPKVSTDVYNDYAPACKLLCCKPPEISSQRTVMPFGYYNKICAIPLLCNSETDYLNTRYRFPPS